MSERASKQVSAAECAGEASSAEQANGMSGASERANKQASGPVFQSGLLVILDHSATEGLKTLT